MQLDARLISSVAFEAPTSAWEEAVVNIWQKVGKMVPQDRVFAVRSIKLFKSETTIFVLGPQLHRHWCAR